MGIPRHPAAFDKARALVDAYDGRAERMVSAKIEDRVISGDLDEALELDQVRRGIEEIYEAGDE